MSTSIKVSMVLFVTLLCMVPSVLGQQAPAPAPDCTDSLTSLLPCLDFVTDSSDNVTADCCSALTDVRTNSPLCLCSFLGANSSDLGINVTRALELPTICNVAADPADCAAAGVPLPPSTSPVAAPVPATTPAPPTTSPSPVTSPAPVTTPATAPTTAPSTSPITAPTTAPTTAPPVGGGTPTAPSTAPPTDSPSYASTNLANPVATIIFVFAAILQLLQ